MKKKIGFLLVVLMALSCFIITACNGNPKDSNNNTDTLLTLDVDYMQYLTAEITDATALGIKKETRFVSKAKNNSANKMIAYAEETEEETKTYLYKSTEDYQNGDIEFDETGLTKVAFKKNTNVTEEVYDADGNLIESNTTITQNEIPAQINKVYVNHGFTFIQFIPVVSQSGQYNYKDNNGNIQSTYIEVRPADSMLTLDSNGIPTFDKTNYFSDALHQSFVIDNNSGYIYKIDNFRITEIKNGLFYSNDIIYDNKVNEDASMEFYKLIENETIIISDAFKDKYGNIFVKNDSLNESKNNIIMFKEESNYFLSEQGYAVNINERVSWGGTGSYPEIKKFSENEEWVEINETDTITFNSSILVKIKGHADIKNFIEVKDGVIYMTDDYYDPYAIAWDISSKELIYYRAIYYLEGYKKVLSHKDIIVYNDTSKKVFALDLLTTTNWSKYDDWYQYDVYRGNYSDFTLLLENIDLNGNISELKFKQTTRTETLYYIITITEAGLPEIILESEYIADTTTIKLQPINK